MYELKLHPKVEDDLKELDNVLFSISPSFRLL